jgi:ferredoxin
MALDSFGSGSWWRRRLTKIVPNQLLNKKKCQEKKPVAPVVAPRWLRVSRIRAEHELDHAPAPRPYGPSLSFPIVRLDGCTQCKRCIVECPFGAIDEDEKRYPVVNESRCRRADSYQNETVRILRAFRAQCRRPHRHAAARYRAVLQLIRICAATTTSNRGTDRGQGISLACVHGSTLVRPRIPATTRGTKVCCSRPQSASPSPAGSGNLCP